MVLSQQLDTSNLKSACPGSSSSTARLSVMAKKEYRFGDLIMVAMQDVERIQVGVRTEDVQR